MVYTEIRKGMAEVIITGEALDELRSGIQTSFHPFALYMGTKTTSDLPLVRDKTWVNGRTTVYVCRNKTCLLPVHTAEEASRMIAEQ
jgi:uncharacterized protein YyaL (SSP411 family)